MPDLGLALTYSIRKDRISNNKIEKYHKTVDKRVLMHDNDIMKMIISNG